MNKLQLRLVIDMSVFNEQLFYANFMNYYQQNLGISNSAHEIFCLYFEDQIFMSNEYNQWFKHFFPTHREVDEEMLFDKLFDIIQDCFEAAILSDDDTDVEED